MTPRGRGFDADAFEALLDEIRDNIERREALQERVSLEACAEVDRELRSLDRTMRELRAGVRRLPRALIDTECDEDVLEFIWGVDQATKGFRRVKAAWRSRRPYEKSAG